MKKIYRIARLELSILFYSPIAWLVLIIFIIQCGVTFTDLLYARETNQQLGTELKALTVDVFGGNRGFFASVQNKLYLYIPLLTMGLMSREISSGSIKLLFSSPITNVQIILGKFMAMMAYCFLLVSVLLFITMGAFASIEALDVGFILGGILGLYLLVCAYSAIGLFMSSLTSYQVVAAISTLAVLAALNFVGTIGQSIDFVRDITYWISIDGRADNFINGLISSKDVIYFLLVICFFLTLTVMKLNAGRKIRSQTITVARYSSLAIIVLAIGYVSSRPAFTGYFDTTRFKDRTLTEDTQNLLKKLNKPVKITSYVNLVNSFVHLGSPRWRIFDLKQFDQYTRFLPDIEMNYVTYYDSTMNERNKNAEMSLEELAVRSATAYDFEFEKVLTPNEIRDSINLIPEENSFVRIVEYDGKETALRMYYDMLVYPGESEISAALKRLIFEPPVAGFLTGNDERSIERTGDKGYLNITKNLHSRGALVNQGFDVVNIDINDEQDLPLDLTVLVLADPIGSYSPEHVEKIKKYINNGGNIIIAGEPGKQDILNNIIENLGVTFTEGMLLQESKDHGLDLIQAGFSKHASELGFNFKDDAIVSFTGAVGMDYSDVTNFKITPVLVTNKKYSWNKTEKFNLESDKIVFDEKSDVKAAVPVAIALTRELSENKQKVIVLGDADFMSNGELSRNNLRTKNYEFTVKMFKWFSNGEFPIDVHRPEPIDNKILLSRSGISGMEMMFLGFLPLALGLFGGIVLIRRKRN